MADPAQHRRRRDLTPSSIGLIQARGPLRRPELGGLDALIAACLDDGCRDLVIDLSGAEDHDAAAAKRLIDRARETAAGSGRLVLIRPRPALLQDIARLGGELDLDIADDLPEACDRLLDELPFPLEAGGLRLRRRPSPCPAVLILEARGVLSGAEVPRFEAAFAAILDRGFTRVLIDGQAFRGYLSTGLGSLVKYGDRLANLGGGLALIRLQPKVALVIDLLGLQAFFEIADSLAEGLALLGHPLEACRPPLIPDLHPPFLEGHEPVEDWEYFVRERADGEREGVLFNAGLRRAAPDPRRPYLLALSLPFRRPNDRALLVPPADRQAFSRAERRLLPHLFQRFGARLSSRRTDRRGVTWVFYAENSIGGDEALAELLAKLGEARRWPGAELWEEEDPGWHQYFAILRAGIAPERLARV